jgi:hypothetical protein
VLQIPLSTAILGTAVPKKVIKTVLTTPRSIGGSATLSELWIPFRVYDDLRGVIIPSTESRSFDRKFGFETAEKEVPPIEVISEATKMINMEKVRSCGAAAKRNVEKTLFCIPRPRRSRDSSMGTSEAHRGQYWRRQAAKMQKKLAVVAKEAHDTKILAAGAISSATRVERTLELLLRPAGRAAAKIQAALTGYRTREQAQKAAETLEKAQAQAKQKSWRRRKHEAAAKIQAGLRGYKSRTHV